MTAFGNVITLPKAGNFYNGVFWKSFTRCRIWMKLGTRVCLKRLNDRIEFELDPAKSKNNIAENSFSLGHETHNSDRCTDCSNAVVPFVSQVNVRLNVSLSHFYVIFLFISVLFGEEINMYYMCSWVSCMQSFFTLHFWAFGLELRPMMYCDWTFQGGTLFVPIALKVLYCHFKKVLPVVDIFKYDAVALFKDVIFYPSLQWIKYVRFAEFSH